MVKKLVYSLLIFILFCFSCKKAEQQYKNPVFATFFKELSNKSAEDFYKSYYKEKSDEYLVLYIPVLKELKKYNSEFIITDYNSYKNKKPNIDGASEGVYILENKNIKDIIIVKVENNKVQYLLPIGKGKEDIIGWI